jgi:hypothetical protein
VPRRPLSPTRWVWSPVNSAPSKAMIWGNSPAHLSSPAATQGASDNKVIMPATAIVRIGVPPLEAPTRAARHG